MNTASHLLINAGPGCGKTHSICDAYYYYRASNPTLWLNLYQHTDEQLAIYEWCRTSHPRKKDGGPLKAIYIAYNKSIKETLEKRIHPDCEVRTSHGWGYKTLNVKYGYVPINQKRDQILVEKITGQSFNTLRDKDTWWKSIRYLEKIKEELLPISEDSLYYLNQKYSDLVTLAPRIEMLDQLNSLIVESKKVDKKLGITYIDQVWLSLFLLTSPPYDIGYVDEAQDLSPARLLQARKLCKFLVFCGDPNQAINAFAGADPHSFDKIREYCSTELPLKTSFRLPPNHAAAANRLRPTARIRSTPEKQNGGQYTISFSQLHERVAPAINKKPIIICRYNAPLVKAALHLIKHDIPCRSLGDTLVKQLSTLFKGFKSTSLSDLHLKLDIYESKMRDKGSQSAKEQNLDRISCIRYVLESCDSPQDFEPILKSLLRPSKDNYCLLSTVHKAKGLETSELFILFPPVQSTRAETQEAIEQEENINFVARTRSSNNITEVIP